jgi:succinylglutamate desuccinylase
MASKKQKRFVQRAVNKANSGVPESDEEFEERLAAEELIERNQLTDDKKFYWSMNMRKKRF